MSSTPLHSSIIALVSLSAGIASKHPDMGLCQLEKLRGMGISESQIDTVVEISRHIREEAGQKLDAAFDQASRLEAVVEDAPAEMAAQACCTSTASGQSCC